MKPTIEMGKLFDAFPTINTERLHLRQIVRTDAADVFVFRSDAAVMQYIPRPLAQRVEDVYPLFDMLDEFWRKKEKINWGIALKETNTIIGMIGYVDIYPEHARAELGYSLARAYHGQGIMSEALSKVVQFGFDEVQFHSITAIIDAQNKPSEKILKRFGFRQEAFFREDFYYNEQYRDSIHFGLLKSEFEYIR